MRLFIALSLCLLFSVPVCFAQSGALPKRSCGTDAYMEQLVQQDPALENRIQQVTQATQQHLRQKPSQQYLRQANTITIPVVFHVVYVQGEENISDEQILSQLQVLNDDFRRKNKDASQTPSYFAPFAADTELEFCLATIDPNGNPTTGITRTQTNYRSDFDEKFTAKGGKDAWDTKQYLNIWITDLGRNLLGYATLPGSPANVDGVVLNYVTVGAYPANRFNTSYNLGRTATHEVGHWLGLGHIWGSGSSCNDSDGIADTPNQLEENGGCPTGVMTSCSDAPYGDMYQNYMDYTDDACMNLFTQGQAAYMRAIIQTARPGILTSSGCTGKLKSDFKTEVKSDTLVAAGTTVLFTNLSAGAKPIAYYWEFEGGTPATSTEENPKVTYQQPGVYDVKLSVSNGTHSATELKEDYVEITVSDLTIYPNPASEFILVEQPAKILVRHVELVNHVGQTVLTAVVRDRVVRLDVRDLPAGIYFLRVLSTNGTILKKISIVK